MNVQLAAGASLEALQKALADSYKAGNIGDPRMPDMMKSTFAQSGTATSGLTFYDLQPGALLLYPVLTPLRNEIPRVSGKGGIQANWRAITNINTANLSAGVSGGQRNATLSVSTADYIAVYKGIGMESDVTFEAQYAGQGFDDIRALAGMTGLQSLMLQEEFILLAGNGSVQLGTTPTPTLAGVASPTGGALSNGTYRVACVALTAEGLLNSSVSGGVVQQITRTNADGTTDTYGGGAAQKSAEQTVTLSAGTSVQGISATVTAVRGAVAYAWFLSAAAGGAGTSHLNQITNAPEATLIAVNSSSQLYSALASADYSVNNLIFDGLITQAFKSGSNAYWADLGGDTLTADGTAGIVEIDAALKSLWDNYRLSPDTMWVSSTEALAISQKILAGNANGAFRINVDQAQGMQVGGIMATTYLNRFSMAGAQTVRIRIHPNMPQGVILMTAKTIPYPLSGVGNVMQVRTRQDYYQIEWPLRTRRYEYGVYADEVLQHFFPPSMALITGIGAD